MLLLRNPLTLIHPSAVRRPFSRPDVISYRTSVLPKCLLSAPQAMLDSATVMERRILWVSSTV